MFVIMFVTINFSNSYDIFSIQLFLKYYNFGSNQLIIK
jgi:hypothetical protein